MQTVLEDHERRVAGNLSIPRTVGDLTRMLREDPHFQKPPVDDGDGPRPDPEPLSERDVHDWLESLQGDGLVVNLGDGRDHATGELAALVDRHKTARSMPDEKARIFERRMKVGHRRWRLAGDVWAYTDRAHATLIAPSPLAGPPLDEERLIAAISAEARRVHDVDPEHPSASYSHLLLPSEYDAWRDAVLEDHRVRAGLDALPPYMRPIAGGAGYSDAWELLGVDAENGKGTSFQITAPWFMALTTVAVTDADTGSTITEATYTGYARKSVAGADMNAAASGAATNANAIIYAACTAGSSTCIGAAKCIAVTVGVMQKYLTIASTAISTTQTPAQFAVGAFSTSLD